MSVVAQGGKEGGERSGEGARETARRFSLSLHPT